MYLLRELFLASPLIIYTGLRIRALISNKDLKNASSGLFLLIVAGYPSAEALAHGPRNGLFSAFVFVGYSCLPLLLYLIMTVLSVDLITGTLRLSGFLSKATVQSPRSKKLRLLFIMGIPLLAVGLGIVNHNVLRVKEYRIELPKRSGAMKELRLLFMADLHLRELTSDRFLDKLVERVNAQRPDIILIGGDILEGDRRGEDLGRYERLFQQMKSKYGLYAVQGNHERHGMRRSAFFERSGIRLLNDETVIIEESFSILGLSDSHRRTPKSLTALLQSPPRDLPRILVKHRPEWFDYAIKSGIDLQLSGHTHHGQLFPNNILTSLEYDLSWGYLRRDKTQFIVTSGVQGWGPPVRTAGRSEILLIHISFTTEN